MPDTPNAVTQLSPAPKPRRTGKDGKAPCVPSAKQNVYLPGWPMVAMSPTPARAPPTFRVIRLTARPMQAFARLPGPRIFPPAFSSSVSTTGPWTQMATVAVPVVLNTPSRLNRSSSVASTAVSTTGSSAGRQPARMQL